MLATFLNIIELVEEGLKNVLSQTNDKIIFLNVSFCSLNENVFTS